MTTTNLVVVLGNGVSVATDPRLALSALTESFLDRHADDREAIDRLLAEVDLGGADRQDRPISVAALIVSIVAVSLAAGSLYVSLSQNSRDVLRFAREKEEADREGHAVLSAAFGAISGSSRGIEYTVAVTNFGKDFARHIEAWFTDEEGNRVGVAAQQRKPIQPGGSAELIVTAPTRVDYDGPLTLRMSWLDPDDSHHKKKSSIVVPLL